MKTILKNWILSSQWLLFKRIRGRDYREYSSSGEQELPVQQEKRGCIAVREQETRNMWRWKVRVSVRQVQWSLGTGDSGQSSQFLQRDSSRKPVSYQRHQIMNNYSLKWRWIVNNYTPKWRWILKYILPSREAARWILFTRHRYWGG